MRQPFDRTNFSHHNNTPAPQVDFELRHTREHLEKLKFNWLELHTKRTFLAHLSDADGWRACQTSRWTPGELKQLERSVEPVKAALKSTKEATVEWERRLQVACETIAGSQDTVLAKAQHVTELTRELAAERLALSTLQAALPAADQLVRPIEELQTLLDEQSIQLEKRMTALERQRAAIGDLERLLSVHEGENERTLAMVRELEERQRSMAAKEATPQQRTLTTLSSWYKRVQEALERMAGVRVELVQGNYLVATVEEAVPVHIWVDPASGHLRAVKIGSTSATPKRQWRELIEVACECNDIPFLLRSIQAALRKQ